MNHTSHKRTYPKIILLLIALVLITLTIIVLRTPTARRKDYVKILTTEYDSAFLSMYPIDNYPEEAFQDYFELTIFKASYCIPEFSTIRQYMRLIGKSRNSVHTIYLGIRPDRTDIQELQELLNQYPSVSFEIILSYPSMDYWTNLSEAEYTKALADYSSFLLAAPNISNAHFFFPGSQEWLIANPGNYETQWQVNDSISMTILLNSTILGEYYVVLENSAFFSQTLSILTQQARTTPDTFPDLSNHCLVFLGDSVIGNYVDSASIPGVISGFTQATVYNCGLGGNSASVSSDSPIALAGIAEAFARGDLSALPTDTQVYQGISSYLSESPSDKKLSIIINYGLNDYFFGCPVSSSENPFDISTFCGAIRTAVNTIRTEFPDAQIILCTPSFCHYYMDGTEPHGDGDYVLEEYVNAILSLSQELHTDALDTYHDFGINSSNWSMYLLPDQVHPNAAYRYLIGTSLIPLIR